MTLILNLLPLSFFFLLFFLSHSLSLNYFFIQLSPRFHLLSLFTEDTISSSHDTHSGSFQHTLFKDFFPPFRVLAKRNNNKYSQFVIHLSVIKLHTRVFRSTCNTGHFSPHARWFEVRSCLLRSSLFPLVLHSYDDTTMLYHTRRPGRK